MAFTRYTIQNNYSTRGYQNSKSAFLMLSEIYKFFMTEMPDFWDSIKLYYAAYSKNNNLGIDLDDVDAFGAADIWGGNYYLADGWYTPNRMSKSSFTDKAITYVGGSSSYNNTDGCGCVSIHFFDKNNNNELFRIGNRRINTSNKSQIIAPTFFSYNMKYEWLYRHRETNSSINGMETAVGNSDVEQFLYYTGTLPVSKKCAGSSETPSYFFLNGIRGQVVTSSWIKEIIKINENAVAFTFGSSYTTDATCNSKGVLIFTKSNKGNISVIGPSEGLCNSRYTTMVGANERYRRLYDYDSYNYVKFNDEVYLVKPNMNKLLCMNINSVSEPVSYSSIPYESEFGDKTILNPILVPGCDEYIPKCFYVPVSQYIIPANNDTFLFINGKKYWYNGFIAVELDDE